MDDPDLALKLIEQVKNYECLYNPNDAYFNDYKHKNSIWKMIAYELNITGKYVLWFKVILKKTSLYLIKKILYM